MSEVHVTFPEQGKTLVDNDPQAVVSGRRIQWHFFSQHPAAAKAGIVFEDPTAQIFKVNGKWQHHFETELTDNRSTMWGQPPKQHAPQTRWKYTIVVWDEHGEEIKQLVLDPKIIIDDP